MTRRLLALALILDGCKRADAARLSGMDRQALRDWVHCYNADGVAGLADRHGGGATRRLSAEQEAAVAGWVRAGPDLAKDKVVRWRRSDIQARIAELFGVALHERSVGKSGKALAEVFGSWRQAWRQAASATLVLMGGGPCSGSGRRACR